MRAADRWARDLAKWAIPDEILAQAPESPWTLPPTCFTPDANPATRATTLRAIRMLAARGPDPVVLDIGCGAGRASLALVPPASRIIGVDSRQSMLERFEQAAAERGVSAESVLGEWPDVASRVDEADLVLCAQVLYNVAAIEPFIHELVGHSRGSVIIELDATHPMEKTRAGWREFWGLERPEGPDADLLLEVLSDMGIDPEVVRVEIPLDDRPVDDSEIERMRRRLCLTADRDAEIGELLRRTRPTSRHLVTLWWDV